MSVAYSSISRKGEAASCLIGQNQASWSLECSDWGFVATHVGHRVGAVLSDSAPCRVGVFLDWPHLPLQLLTATLPLLLALGDPSLTSPGPHHPY